MIDVSKRGKQAIKFCFYLKLMVYYIIFYLYFIKKTGSSDKTSAWSIARTVQTEQLLEMFEIGRVFDFDNPERNHLFTYVSLLIMRTMTKPSFRYQLLIKSGVPCTDVGWSVSQLLSALLTTSKLSRTLKRT